MNIPLVLLFLTAPSLYAFSKDVSNFNGDILNQDDVPRESTDLALHRQRRDAIGANLETTVTQLQQTARITNAIALQQGLAAGTIDSNTLIPELLNFGPVTLDEIIQLDDQLPATLASLKDLPAKVSDSNGVKHVEQFFIAVNTILTAFGGFENVSEWRGRSDFTDDVEKLINRNVDLGIIRNMSLYLTEWKFNYNKLEMLGTTTDYTAEHQQQLKNLKESSQKFIELSSQEFPNPTFFKNNNSASTAFSEVTRLIDAFEVYGSNFNKLLKPSQSDNKEMETTLTEISAFSSSITANEPVVGILQRIFAWKLSSSNLRSTTFTSGLPKGYSDIEQVFIDLHSPFIKHLVDTGKLEIAVKPLKELGSAVGKFDQKLDATVLKDSEQIPMLLNKLREVNRGTSDIPAVMSALTALGSCAQNPESSPNDPGKKNMAEKIKQLDDQISNARKLIGEARDLLISNKNLLEETIKACTAIDKTDQAGINDEFRKFFANPKVSETSLFIEDLNTKLTNIGLATISNLAKEVKKVVDDVDKYHPKLGKYQPFLNCFRAEKNLDLVFSTVSTSKYLRENASEFNDSIDKVAGVAKKVISTKEDLKTMDATLKKMKGLKNPETDALKLFSDAQKHSNVIGGATRGVVSMTKAIKEKDNVQKLVNGFGLIEAGMKKIGMRSKRSISDQELNGLLAMKGEVDQMYTSLGQFNDGAKDLKVTKFQDLSAIFPDAQKIPGIQLDFVKIGESVGELADKINDASSPELKNLQSILNSLDLDFSKHHQDFASCQSSLGQLDVFFAKAKKKNSPVPTPSPSGQSALPPSKNGSQPVPTVSPDAQQGSESDDSTEKPDEGIPIWVIIVIVVVVVLLVVAGFIVYLLCFKKKKEPAVPPEDPVNDSDSNSGDLKKPTEEVKTMKTDETKVEQKPEVKPEEEKQKDKEKEKVEEKVPEKVEEKAPEKVQDKELQVEDTQKSYKVVPLNTTKKLDSSVGESYLMIAAARIRKFNEAEHIYKDGNSIFCAYFIAVYNGLYCDNIFVTPQLLRDNARECRYHLKLIKVETRVPIRDCEYKFASDFYHANIVTFDSKLRFILAQAPQDNNKKKDKVETIRKTWVLIRQQRVENIVMLCRLMEPDEDEGGKLREKCSKYFPENVGEVLKFEKLTVKCTEKKTMCNKEVIIRTISVKFDGSEEFTVKHYQYVAWPDFGAPKNPHSIIALLKLVRGIETPVFVHCSAGIGRSGSFALIEMGYEELCETGDVNLSKLVIKLREMRADAVQTAGQLAFCIRAIVEWGIEDALQASDLSKQELTSWQFIKAGSEAFGDTYKELEKAKEQMGKEMKNKKEANAMKTAKDVSQKSKGSKKGKSKSGSKKEKAK